MLHSTCQQIWKTQQWPQDLKRSVFIPIPKQGSAKECANYHSSCTHFYASKVMLKILCSTVRELRTSRCSSWIYKMQRNQRSNCQHQLDHRESKIITESMYFCFIDYIKAFDYVDHNKLENSSRDGNTRTLTCFLRNLYAGL